MTTVKQLRDILNGLDERHDDDRVGVVVQKNVMGGTPCVDVRNVGCGFDWNKGKFMIWCEKELIEINKNKDK